MVFPINDLLRSVAQHWRITDVCAAEHYAALDIDALEVEAMLLDDATTSSPLSVSSNGDLPTPQTDTSDEQGAWAAGMYTCCPYFLYVFG